jgi:hypothetical protein
VHRDSLLLPKKAGCRRTGGAKQELAGLVSRGVWGGARSSLTFALGCKTKQQLTNMLWDNS